MADPLHVYTAESRTRNVGYVLREMVQGLRRAPYLAYRLALKDIRGARSKMFLGFFWDLADPLVLGLIFYVLMRTRVLNPGEISISYATFVIFGLLLYATFSDAVVVLMDLPRSSKVLLEHVKIPAEALILSGLFRVGFTTIFRVCVMLLFAGITGDFSLPGFATFLCFLPIYVLCAGGIGLFFAPWNTLYNDVGRLVRVALVPLRYVSPVLFLLPQHAFFDVFNRINPLASWIPFLRNLATMNMWSDVSLVTTHTAVCLGIGVIAWFLFHATLPILAERV